MQTNNIKEAFLDGRDGSKVPQRLFEQLRDCVEKRKNKTKEYNATAEKSEYLKMEIRLEKMEIEKITKKINKYL